MRNTAMGPAAASAAANRVHFSTGAMLTWRRISRDWTTSNERCSSNTNAMIRCLHNLPRGCSGRGQAVHPASDGDQRRLTAAATVARSVWSAWSLLPLSFVVGRSKSGSELHTLYTPRKFRSRICLAAKIFTAVIFAFAYTALAPAVCLAAEDAP